MVNEAHLDIPVSDQSPTPRRWIAHPQLPRFGVPQRLPTLFVALASFMLLGCFSSPQVWADVYYYTGNEFTTDVGGSSFVGDAITGEFTYYLGTLPADATTNVELSGPVFSFTAGPVTINQIGAAVFALQVTTDASDNIVGWEIDVRSSSGNTEIFSFDPTAGTGDEVDIYSPGQSAYTRTSPGTWTDLPIPEPTSLVLLGVAVFGLRTVRRRSAKGRTTHHPPV